MAMRSTSSSLNPLRQPETISSTVVPGWPPHRRGQRLELGPGRRTRGHRLAVAVVVGVGLGGREPERPLGQRLLEGGSPWPPPARGWPRWPTASSPMATRRSVEWPTRKPALTPTRPSSRPSHSPNAAHASRARPGGRPAACPPPGPSCRSGSRRGRARSGPARTRSCRRSRWSPRAAATGWPSGPRTAGRRSGCGGRRSPGPPPGRRRRSPGWPARRPRPGPPPGRRGPPRRPSRAGAPGAVDHRVRPGSPGRACRRLPRRLGCRSHPVARHRAGPVRQTAPGAAR